MMGKKLVTEVAPLLLLDHLEVGVSLSDSRHARLDINSDNLALHWSPGTHLSVMTLVVSLLETVLLFPPMPSLPEPYVVPQVKASPPFMLSVNGEVRNSLLSLYASDFFFNNSSLVHIYVYVQCVLPP